MAKQQHNIEKISVNVNTSSSVIGNLYKDKLPRIINSEFLADADNLFSSICSENENLIVEQITLEINVERETDFTFLRKKLVEKLKERLDYTKTKKLNSKSKQPSISKNSTLQQEHNFIDGYLYFLKTGLKPWWINKEKLDNILYGKWQEIFKDIDDFNVLINTILADSTVQKRFIKQQTNALGLFYFLHSKEMSLNIEKDWKTWNSENQNLTNEINDLVQRFIHPLFFKLISESEDIYYIENNLKSALQLILEKWINTSVLKDDSKVKTQILSWSKNTLILFDILSKRKINQNQIQLSIESEIKKYEDHSFSWSTNGDIEMLDEDKRDSKKLEKEWDIDEEISTIYLSHAGLILVYPFIKELFKSCKLLNSSGGISSNDRAVHLLHFVATKKLRPSEHELTLEKLLCGIPTQTPIEKEVTLTEKQINEADEMLMALSEHWTAIKNSSPDAIRSTFLIREGKLEDDDFGKTLFVQRKTEDILIDKLPWSISIVKTPWMKNFLTVEW